MEAAEIREMILELALAKAHRLVGIVDANELDISGMNDTLTIDEVDWHINVAYDRDSGNVGIQAHPIRPPQSLFEVLGWTSPNDHFGYSLPASWLPSMEQEVT